ncbi:MAG: hypothetical protein ACTSYJ_09340 [Candidatus Thorarchaeota archaeon]
MKRVKPILLITIFITTMLIVPSALVINSLNGDTNMMGSDGSLNSQALISQLSHNARVAIYDEDNLTVPAISQAVNLTNNLAEITTLLEGAGHTVDLLTEADILSHELLTADYDVFLLVNNVPRPSIANLVKEFWLGGGGLMSFNGAMSYLWYGGILEPSFTTDKYVSHWLYLSSDTQNVSARHPTMKEHHINDTISERAENWALTADNVLDDFDIWSDTTILMRNVTFTHFVTAFAVDLSNRGGRIVQLPGDGSSIPTDFESIIVDSVEWLIPQPKGRIAYDLSHKPRLSVDSWDGEFSTLTDPTFHFEELRTLAVNHTYTFDKFYPSSEGNFTAARLAKYDVIILSWPDIDYSSTDRTALMDWVEGGGSLLILGDRTGLIGGGTGDVYINQLIQDLDMSLGTTDVINYASMTPATHVTLEGCSSLYIGYRNYLVVLGNATEIWMDGTDCVVAGQEYGLGRVILSADMNIFDSIQLGQDNNIQYALNALNWLTAANAEVLVFTDYGYTGTYRDPVALAMNDLGISYQLFRTSEYIDDFLDSKSWELFVLNEVNYALTGLELDDIYAYVNAGGRLLLSYFDMDAHPTHPLWSKLGVEHSTTLSGSPEIFVWEASHAIFTDPNDHSAVSYTSGAGIGDDGDSVTVLAGYIALAGTTADVQAGNAVMVVSSDKQTLFNPFLIDNFVNDDDDSTYEDRVELWENLITYMMVPGGGLPFNLDTTTLLIIGGAVLGLIIIMALLRKRGGSKPKPRKRKKK